MKRLFLASLVSATLIGCGGSDGGDKKPTTPEQPDTSIPTTPLEPSTPVEPDQPLIPLEPSTPIVPPTDLTPANYAPEFDVIPNFAISVHEEVSYQLIASDFNGDLLTYGLTSDQNFISVGVDGHLYIYASYESIGTHKVTVMVSDGKLETTATFEVVINIPLVDLTPSDPLPTEDCGSGGECLEDNFEMNHVYFELVDLGLTKEELQIAQVLCNTGNCGVDSTNGMFFVQGFGARYYPKTKTMSLSTYLEAANFGYDYEVMSSGVEFSIDSSKKEKYVVEIFTGEQSYMGMDVLAVMMEFDIVEFFNQVKHPETQTIYAEVLVEKTIGGLTTETNAYLSAQFDEEATMLLSLFSKSYGGEEAYLAELAKRAEVDAVVFSEACSNEYNCYGYPDRSVSVASGTINIIIDAKPSRSAIKMLTYAQAPEYITDTWSIATFSAQVTIEGNETWAYNSYDSGYFNEELNMYEIWTHVYPDAEFLASVKDNVAIVNTTLNIEDFIQEYSTSITIKDDVMLEAITKRISK